MTIVPFLKDSVFGPQDIQAMSTALEDVCKILNVAEEAKSQREQLAKKIITLAHQHQCNAGLLRDRILREIAVACFMAIELKAGLVLTSGSRGALRSISGRPEMSRPSRCKRSKA